MQRRKITAIMLIVIGLSAGLFLKNVKIGLIIGLLLGVLSGGLLSGRKK